ncbi:prenyltransferase-like protein [Bisporella sp. PMI_857]|nr:prenyltransferase-like protein [Bisporella sp. PMI_857]
MASPTKFEFSTSQFLEDIRTTAAAIGAPFSESTTRKVLDVFTEQFKDGGIVLRTSNQATSKLDYRSFMRKKTDIMSLALGEGFIEKDDPLNDLIASWSALYDGRPEASCDFSADGGLAKIWLFFGAIRPLDEILAAPGVPESIRRHGPTFHSLGLTDVQHIAVDYHRRSINLYFAYFGETTQERAAALTKLAQPEPPNDTWFKQMSDWLPQDGTPFAVTLTLDGAIKRVCFYALRGLPEEAEKVDPTITKFWSAAPCHDEDNFKTLGWSFGGEPYLKTERGYAGNIAAFGEYWGVFPDSLEATA